MLPKFWDVPELFSEFYNSGTIRIATLLERFWYVPELGNFGTYQNSGC